MSNANDKVVARYKGVISALVPFAARGKLQEGLNKFKSRINEKDLEEIRYEVARLIQPTEHAADNSKFAKGKTRTIHVQKVKVKLDNVGERILNEELKRHNNTYTTGVKEAISSESRYKSQVKKEAYDELVESFSIDCVTNDDALPVDNIKIVPKFTVSSPVVDDSTPLSIHYLGTDELALSFAAKPTFYGGESLTLTFPAFSIDEQEQIVAYTCKGVRSIDGGKKYAVLLTPEDRNDETVQMIANFIRNNLDHLPLEPEQEALRANHNLLKDSIVANMPMTATLCEIDSQRLAPRYTLLPSGWEEQHPGTENTGLTMCKMRFSRLSQEFKRSRETYQFSMIDWEDGNKTRIVGFLNELKNDGTLASFIKAGLANDTLRVHRLTMVACVDSRFESAMHLDAEDIEVLDQGLRYVVYCADVTRELDSFQVSVNQPVVPLPDVYKESPHAFEPAVSLPRQHDRRQEPRFNFTSKVNVKAGLMSSADGQIMDLSTRGLRVKLSEPLKRVKEQVKINMPSLSLTGVRYHVVRYDASHQELRLRMTEESADRHSKTLTMMQLNNADFFASRSQSSEQEKVFKFLWKLVSVSAPGVHIMLGKGNDVKDQLIVAHSDGMAQSVLPFKIDNNKLPTHGWFADSQSASEAMKRLSKFVKKTHSKDRALFYIDKTAKRYTQLSSATFARAPVRQNLHGALSQNKGQLIAHHLQTSPYKPLDDNWYAKRCQLLSQVDKMSVKRLKREEANRHRVLSIIPVSLLHTTLLDIGDFTGTQNMPELSTLSA